MTRLESCQNIYKTARISACFSVEQAAELAGISVSSLKDYEAYARIPPICTVDRMCAAYHSTILAYQHIRMICGSVQVVPDVQLLTFQAAAIRLYNRVVAFCRKNRGDELLEIAEDGKITGDEWPLYAEIAQELKELTKASLELELATEEA